MRQLLRRALAPALALATALVLTAPAGAQGLTLPRVSQKGKVSQTIGVTEVSLEYSRPGVKGRKIWGGLVPYGEIWRTGANENTLIHFSDGVQVEGHPLAAGSYGLHTLPGPDRWTLIFSKKTDAWGSFQYKPAEDALRVEVTPREAPFQEWMGFEFDDLTPTSADVVLRWEKLAVPFRVETDTPANLVHEVEGAVSAQALNQAASYCVGASGCDAQAGRWIEAAVLLDPSFWNYRTLARLQAKKGDFSGAVASAGKAFDAVAGMSGDDKPSDNVLADLKKAVEEWKTKAM